MTTARIGVYLRISEDRDGQQTATDRQRDDCRRFAEARGWEVVDVFEDVDLSAYKASVKRPEFDRMLEAVRGGQLDGVLAWKLDRISRRMREFVRLDEACEQAGAFIATVADGIDTHTPAGRMVAEVLVAQARMESENASVRIRRKHLELAKQGRPQAGGSRMFGYSQDRMTLIEDEAAAIRDAARRLVAGESLTGISNDWNAAGITTTRGGPWRRTSLRRLFVSPALSGQRYHRGVFSPGCWPAILTPEDTDHLRALLLDPARNKVHNPRKYLLAGFLRCGRCGNPLIARPKLGGERRYVCARRPGEPSCGRLARLAEPVEALVAESVMVALEDVDVSAFVEPTDDNASALEAIRRDEDALERLSRDHYVDGAIDRAEYFAARDALHARLTANRDSITRHIGSKALGSVLSAGAGLRQQWPAQSFDWHRAVLGAVIDHVVLLPAVRGLNRFDPSLVRIVWKF